MQIVYTGLIQQSNEKRWIRKLSTKPYVNYEKENYKKRKMAQNFQKIIFLKKINRHYWQQDTMTTRQYDN